MDFQELKSKSRSELQKLLVENRERLRERRFKVANGQLKDVREIRELRHLIARILTLLAKEPTKKV
jgi:large subunit ribosomal protein L29